MNHEPWPRQITIIGSGALGSLFASLLAEHAEIAMLSHWEEQIEAVKTHGLILLDSKGRQSTHQIQITSNPRDLEPVDLALILVKSYQTVRAGYELAPVLAPDGLVITLQNGLGNLEALQAALGRGRVIQGITAQGATMMGAGRVRHAGYGPTNIAQAAGKGEVLSKFINLLNKAAIGAEIIGDVKGLQWGKLAVNAGINALTAILKVRNGYLIEHENAKRAMCAAAQETAVVADALGISLPYDDVCGQVTAVAEATADNYSSMLQDVLRGAPTEIDSINGAVANFGRQIGVSTPINEKLWRQVRAIHANPDDFQRDMFLNNLLELIR
jgi:2-dehydropantoate 2-reductase